MNGTHLFTVTSQRQSILRHLRTTGLTSLAALFATGVMWPAYADITNDATASGSYGASTIGSNTSSVAIPVVPANKALSVTKSAGTPTTAGGVNSSITDSGDTITYTFTVKNDGNVTLTHVSPVDGGVTFGGLAGTGSMGTFSPDPTTVTLAPGATQVFTADYTLSQLDVDRAAGTTGAVSNIARATGTAPDSTTVTSTDSPPATTTIAAGPLLNISKAGVLNDVAVGGTNGKADVGDTITYTYTVKNTGNVAITNVSINDVHEVTTTYTSAQIKGETLVTDGPLASATPAVTSSDTTANDGVWSVLEPGATITFTYTHTVTQAEVDGG